MNSMKKQKNWSEETYVLKKCAFQIFKKGTKGDN
ncbi:hypothetical protein BAMTA208_06390 [Bacillus amyloliquefaciens TA208]|nr:hypothetical protein BAMTA208_06390 [Bacillus amyloliquefaciens TA208]